MNPARAAVLFMFCPVIAAGAQQQRFYYPAPPSDMVDVVSDVPFATVDTVKLAMDIYRPATRSSTSPALIFFIPFDAGRQPTRLASDWIKSWAKLAAANGIIGVIADLRDASSTDDFRRVVSYLNENGTKYGLDRDRLAIFSASGPVAQAFPLAEDPQMTAIKAAVMYYGRATVPKFRLDLPVLYVRAGLDHPDMNEQIVELASLAVSQNAPLTLLNFHTGHHGFEGADDDDAMRDVMDQTIAFVKRATSPSVQSALRAKHLDAVAAGHLSTRNYREAAATFAELMKLRPNDGFLGFRYAQALLSDKQYSAACTEFSKPASPSFAAIMPGTRACVLSGSVDTAMGFLKKFRKDWFRSEYVQGLRTEADFQPLWTRADFQALFN